MSRHILDIPNHRSSHSIPTPRGGGLAFVFVFTLMLLMLALMHKLSLQEACTFIGGGLLVAVVGFLDDKRSLTPGIRLAMHFMASLCVLMGLGGMPSIMISAWVFPAGIILNGIVVIYLGWLLNLYNFMDGIDGIAGIEAISVCLGAVFLYQWCDLPDLMLLPLVLAATVAGFLVWNFPPARIFMGDAGSGFLGLMLGALAIQAAVMKPMLFWSWLILLGVFIIDATVTLLYRLVRGEKVHQAHCSHAYQHAARRFGRHLPVTYGVLVINVVWLWPFAWLVGCGYLEGFSGLCLAYTPLIMLSALFSAGMSEN